MLSKTALNALKAFTVLADLPAGSYAGAGAIAEKIGAGQNYLGKLLQSLIDQGLVTSQKGLGGFRLTKTQITLYDVVEPIDHVSRWEGCFMGERVFGKPCSVHDRWRGSGMSIWVSKGNHHQRFLQRKEIRISILN
jgi:Rrf2 family protein